MTRSELLKAIDRAFENHVDHGTSLELLRSVIRTLINDYCDNINDILNSKEEVIDGLISGDIEMP